MRAARAASGAADTVSFDWFKPTKVWEVGPGVRQLEVLAMHSGTKLAGVCIAAGAAVWCCGEEGPHWMEVPDTPSPPVANVQGHADPSPAAVPKPQPPVEDSPEIWISVAVRQPRVGLIYGPSVELVEKDEVFKTLWSRLRVRKDVQAVIVRSGNVEPVAKITQNRVQPGMSALIPKLVPLNASVAAMAS